MDLLATVRKEGSRGGAGDFKWSDVQNSSHREHYLGHSLMAPVGRWQKNRDLSWYSKSDEKGNDGENPEERMARERKEEIRKIKEAEEDALARALGLPVPERSNPNLESLGNKKEIDRAVREAVDNSEAPAGKGIGYGALNYASRVDPTASREQIKGNKEPEDKEMQYALREYARRHSERPRRPRSRSRDQGRRHRSRSRSRSRDRGKRRRSRSRGHRESNHRPDEEYARDHHRYRDHRSRRSSRERDHAQRRYSRERSHKRGRQSKADSPDDNQRDYHGRMKRVERSRSPYQAKREETARYRVRD